MTVFDIINEPLVIHAIGDADTRAERVRELMRLVAWMRGSSTVTHTVSRAGSGSGSASRGRWL